MIVSCAVYGSKTFGMYSASGSSARTVDDGLDTPRCGRRGADGCQIKHPTHDRGHKHMRDGRCCSSGVRGYHPIVSFAHCGTCVSRDGDDDQLNAVLT